MNQSKSEVTVASNTTRQLWEEAIRDAREGLIAAKSAGEPVDGASFIRMRLACDVESAYELALREAECLAENVRRLIRRLQEDGPGALTGGNNYSAQARSVAEAITTLEIRREAFGLASTVVERKRAAT